MPTLHVEHVALNVPDSKAMAAWYVANLGMRIVRSFDAPPYIHFVADAAGRVVLELYTNAKDAVPDYRSMHPLRFHIAFASASPEADRDALVAAGAAFVDATEMNGALLLMLRDPWGVPLQLCRRAAPLLPPA